MRFGNNFTQKLVYMYDHLISSQCDIMKFETVALTEWNLINASWSEALYVWNLKGLRKKNNFFSQGTNDSSSDT